MTIDILSDEELWTRFQTRTLAAPDWTHAAHLRVAWMHLARHSIDEAHLRMRVGIIRLNLSHGLEETATRGYHETITRAWLELVAGLRFVKVCESSAEFLEHHAGSLERDALLNNYSRDRLHSLEARTRYLEPDQD